ncbi:Aste57867_15174 [Aphanomyces stellatus]|uniref:Aste57867_15174 protein n=1 Tax=Aphanomyces stellatus TaxID=120398 RepID=A0A485L5E6_9STRA|nr:hypothetical protein As57867_015118 [Aphanomyces stellatus]VFT91983.1 Aste57867_15174 [Aphanomyces stellatus]
MAKSKQPQQHASPRRVLDAKQFNRRLTLQCGRQVSYAEVGDPRGFPVICLLGMRGHRYHSYLYNNLAHNHSIRLFCIDRPGYGLSDHVASSSLPHPIAFVYIVEQFLTFLRIERFGLMAQSAGCIYALAIAAQPSLATRLVQPIMLVAPWVGIDNPGTLGLLKVAAFCPTALISAGIKLMDVSTDLSCLSASPNYILAAMSTRKDHAYAHFYAPADETPVPFHEFQQRVQAEPNNVLQDAILCLGKCRTGFRFDQVDVHVHVFHGRKDSLVPLRAAQEFVAKLPHADLDVIEDGNHMILFDEDVMEAVFDAMAAATVASLTPRESDVSGHSI